jgi:glycosidase
MLASFLQYTLPGSPSLYYADEAGMEGCKDPFNRRTYPWGREDRDLLTHFKQLGQLRKNCEALRLGDIQFFRADDRQLGFSRSWQDKKVLVYMNRGHDPWQIAPGKVLLGHNIRTLCADCIILGEKGFCVVEEK